MRLQSQNFEICFEKHVPTCDNNGKKACYKSTPVRCKGPHSHSYQLQCKVKTATMIGNLRQDSTLTDRNRTTLKYSGYFDATLQRQTNRIHHRMQSSQVRTCNSESIFIYYRLLTEVLLYYPHKLWSSFAAVRENIEKKLAKKKLMHSLFNPLLKLPNFIGYLVCKFNYATSTGFHKTNYTRRSLSLEFGKKCQTKIATTSKIQRGDLDVP